MYQSQAGLLKEIDEIRKKMISAARETGYTSKETVRYSQELDQLILDYQTLPMVPSLQREKGKHLINQLGLIEKKKKIWLSA